MAKPKKTAGVATGVRRRAAPKKANLLVRLETGSKRVVQRAAGLRGLTLSDYVRSRILALAQQDVDEAETGVLKLPRDAQMVFWQALQHPPAPTEAQRALGKLIRSVL